MARKPVTDLSAWPSLTLEGNLISPAMVAKIAASKDDEETRQSYRIRKGLSIRDEISTAFRVGQSHFDAFRKHEKPSAEATRRFMREFLTETLGFDDLDQHEGAVCLLAGGRVPIVVTPPDEEKLDRKSPTLSIERSRSAAFALQDYLNDHDDALWGIATNGTILRLMRDNASLTRPAYIEADLSQIFTNEDAASFSILWLLFHRTRFGSEGTPATDCALERWRDAGAKEGEASRDRLAGQVQLALKLLGSGFLEANPELSKRLQSGDIPLTSWFNELLRLVYRLIFLMVAEDRNLLHPPKSSASARKLFAEGYSLSALRGLCTRGSTWDRHHDRYEGIKILFRSLTEGEDALALPALGGLFASDQLPHLGTARLRNRSFMEALYRLSWLTDEKKTGMVPVNWRSMETEELGSVYESLLELQPQLSEDGRSLVFASDAAEQRGNQRKTTGSYYTPDSLVQALLDTALDPVLDRIEAESENIAKALLKLSIIDPACGSGHFLLAAARRIATRLARMRAEGTPSTEDFRHALRDVARCCIHGVDRNPMAVELTKVALWIETVDPGLPLGFFDAQIRCGDALLGVFDLKVLADGIPDAAYKPLTGDDKDTAKYYAQANKGAKGGQGELNLGSSGWQMPDTKPLAVDFSGFRDLPEETVTQIGAKAKRFEELRQQSEFTRVQTAADLCVAAFLLPKTGGAPTNPAQRTVPTTEELWSVLNSSSLHHSSFILHNSIAAARHARAFHWPLEFPDVMQRGGFDVVLGNPPWEVVQISDEEFFAARLPEIAQMKSAARKRAIAELEVTSPLHFAEYVLAKRFSDAQNEFARSSDRFKFSAQGKINTYALFAELGFKLMSVEGNAGLIVPSGIATDYFRRQLFDFLIENQRVSSIHMFDNQLRIFPAVHPDTPFALVTLCPRCARPEFTSYILRIEDLANNERFYQLTRDEIHASNPNTRTLPIYRSREDAKLITKIYVNSQILIKINGDAEFSDFSPIIIQNFFTSSNKEDAEMFESYGDRKDDPDFLPVRRGGNVFLFDHRYGASDEARNLSEEFLEVDRFVPASEVRHRLEDKGWNENWLLGWRDITNATNERTVIASVFPLSATDDTLSLLLPRVDDTKLTAGLLGNLNSLVLDYAAQSKVGGTHIRKNTLAQFPILSRAFYTSPRLDFIVPRVLELTYTSHSLAPFARDLGYDGPPFGWDEDRRALLRAELDAFYARAYNLDRDELRYILDPADVKGPDYPSETFRVLKDREIRNHGEYRTRRLVLEAWDRMVADGTFTALDLSSGTKEQETPIQVFIPAAKDLKDRSWAWPPQIGRKDRLRYAAQYALWISDVSRDAERLRILIACIAEPALLTGWLTKDERILWERLIGPEARPLASGVVRLHPETNAAWKTAFEQLITSGQLREGHDGAWVRGSHFDASGLDADSPDAQRAAFALDAIRRMDIEQLRPLIVLEDNIIWEKLTYGT